MKKIIIILLATIGLPVMVFSQKDKTDQRDMPNETYISYGLASMYLFHSPISHSYNYPSSFHSVSSAESSDIKSFGTIMLGYNRFMGKVIGLGFQFGYSNYHYTKTAQIVDPVAEYISAQYYDNLYTGMMRLTLRYLNSPMLRIYSAVNIGVSVDLSHVDGPGFTDSERKILFAGQFTFFGVRVGRALGGFAEFGFGSNYILQAGLSWQLK